MRKRLLIGCIIAMGAFYLNGCMIRHGDFSVMSNKVVRLSDFELDKADRAKGIIGKDVTHIILFFPTGGPPTLDGAMDDAFAKGGGDVMTDAVVSSWGFWIPFIYGQTGWKVEGDVVKTRKYQEPAGKREEPSSAAH